MQALSIVNFLYLSLCDASLFRYKGMTRFKHLIVNDLEGVFTTAQIGRRLQQLGCVEPRKRKSKLAKMSEDEDDVKRSTPGSADEHISEKEDGVGHCSDDSRESEHTELPLRNAFKAFLGPSARKNAHMSKSSAVVEGETQHGDSSDDDIPIALHMRGGGESAGSKTAGDKTAAGLQKQLGQELLDDQPKVTNTISEINDSDDQLIEDSVAKLVPKTFQRKRPQSGNQSMVPIERDTEKSGDSDSEDDADIAIAKKTSVSKRSSMDQNVKSSTWGDTETGAACHTSLCMSLI